MITGWTRLAVAVMACALALVGCELGSASATPQRRALGYEELAAARARWAEAGFDDYAFAITNACACEFSVMGPFRVAVAGGTVSGITHMTGGQLDPDSLKALPLTVEQMFAMVDDALARAESVSMAFDEQLGYPTLIEIDWTSAAADDEWNFRIGDMVGAP